MSKPMPVKRFADKVMGIKLTDTQIDMIAYVRAGGTIISAPVMSGKSTCRKVIQAYDEYIANQSPELLAASKEEK